MEAIRSLQTLHRSETSPEQVDNVRRMLLAMVEDVRAVVIKLAERIACLREAKKADEETRVLMAQEITNIYAPCEPPGIGQLKWGARGSAFRYLHPDTYKQIAKQLDEKRLDRERYIREFVQSCAMPRAEAGVEAEVYGRPKHIYSIWRKMQKKHLEFNELFDARGAGDHHRGCRIATRRSVSFTPISTIFPANLTTMSPTPSPMATSPSTPWWWGGGQDGEIQIRTEQMHQDAELGVAAHWRYKEGHRPLPRPAPSKTRSNGCANSSPGRRISRERLLAGRSAQSGVRGQGLCLHSEGRCHRPAGGRRRSTSPITCTA